MEDIYDNVPEHLKCPICFDIPKDKVFQCQNGHTFCEACYGSLPSNCCPQCRVELPTTPIRCRAVEGILDGLRLEFPCQFQNAGCEVKLDRKEIAVHSSSCKYDFGKFGNLKRVCGLFGFRNCSFAFNRANTNEALAHFILVHKMRSPKALLLDQFTVVFEHFKEVYNSKETCVFTPLIFDQRGWGHGIIYIIVTSFNPVHKTLHFTPFHLIHGWDGSANVPTNAIPQPIEFTLGHSRGILFSHQFLNLLNCEERTLNDSSYFSAPLKDLLNVDKSGTFSSTFQIRLSHPNYNFRPPQNLRMGDLERHTNYRFWDVLSPILLDEVVRWPTLIRQVCSVGVPQNWYEFQWIACQDYKDFNNHFSPASSFLNMNVLICRANINEEWLVGYIKIDTEMGFVSAAIFNAPNLLNVNRTFSLDENFEILYLPPDSFEWVPWTDLKDKEALAIPVHDQKLDLLICESRRAPGVSLIGTLQKDMNPDVHANIFVLLSKFN